jgi:hypothetical protein
MNKVEIMKLQGFFQKQDNGWIWRCLLKIKPQTVSHVSCLKTIDISGTIYIYIPFLYHIRPRMFHLYSNLWHVFKTGHEPVGAGKLFISRLMCFGTFHIGHSVRGPKEIETPISVRISGLKPDLDRCIYQVVYLAVEVSVVSCFKSVFCHC